MEQTSLFDDDNERVVNVASVPMRSPFRYPGGKTWLIPRIRRWLLSKNRRPSEFIEPFAGGGIVGLTAAFEGLAGHVTMVELDEQLAALEAEGIAVGPIQGTPGFVKAATVTDPEGNEITFAEDLTDKP